MSQSRTRSESMEAFDHVAEPSLGEQRDAEAREAIQSSINADAVNSDTWHEDNFHFLNNNVWLYSYGHGSASPNASLMAEGHSLVYPNENESPWYRASQSSKLGVWGSGKCENVVIFTVPIKLTKAYPHLT